MAIFSKQGRERSAATEQSVEGESVPQLKYPKPKVLFLDLPESASTVLRAKGFNVSVGSIGRPYKVAKSSGYQALIGEGDTPNHTEQDIVVIDLSYGDPASSPQGEKHRPAGEPDLWGKCDKGFIDPRVRTAFTLQHPFDRIHSAGGVFVLFADRKTGIEIQIARSSDNNIYDERPCMRDVWAILSEVADMEVRDDHGTEMQSVKTDSPLVRLLAEFLAGGHFTCTLNGGYRSDGNWETLAVSKFGDPVAVARCRAGHGSVIVLPQIQDKTRFLSELFTTVLPETAPHLFPHIERGKWTHRPEYELPRILEIKAKQREVEKKAKQDIRLLDEELAREREANGWVHTLLIGTDAELVDAVKKALSVLGFAKVIDVDAERDREGKSRREDLQIADQSPTLIVDIKGIGGFPSDEDAFQADKHAAIRMREQGRTDIIGLSIINHQRYLPPLDRENAMPFRKELIDASEERSLGLMTAWDLYRCVTNFQRLAWKSEHVRPLFYKKGRISVVPGHYQFIGKVAKVWTDKFGVVLEQGELKRGELIAVEFPVTFEEARADSLRVRDQAVDSASIGDPVGVPWDAEALKVREGLRVFRVSSP